MKIAIVGHDKTLPGAGLGPAIDAHDCVVKMLNCAWHNPADYGAKYDYAIATKGSFNLASALSPSREIWMYDKRGDISAWNPGETIGVTSLLEDNIKSLGAQAGMSRGCAAVLSAIEILSPKIITLYGMGQIATGIRQIDRHPEIYRDQLTDEQKSILPVDQDHNWQAEHQLIYQVAGLKKCELRTNTNN